MQEREFLSLNCSNEIQIIIVNQLEEASDSDVCSITSKGALHVPLIGNSLTIFNNVMRMMAGLCFFFCQGFAAGLPRAVADQ